MQKYICAAIDIGNTNTRISFKVRDEDEVIIEKWGKAVPHEAPTAALFDYDANFLAFGYEAESRYLEMISRSELCYFLKEFKVNLHQIQVSS